MKILSLSIFEERDENDNLKIPEITSSRIFSKGKFHRDGLFSEHIFGPVQNFICQCGIYHGPLRSGEKCEVCDVPIEHSRERRIRFAQIKLPVNVINPIVYELILTVCNKKILKKLLQDTFYLRESPPDPRSGKISLDIVPSDAPKEEGYKYYFNTEAIKRFVEYEANINIANGQNVDIWKKILKNLGNLITNRVLVIPPDLRPIITTAKAGKQVSDILNRHYTQIIRRKENFNNNLLDINHPKIYRIFYNSFQKDVNELFHCVLERLGRKKGLLRQNILGKRIDFSGRAVIVPEPKLKLDECVIPYKIFLEIFKLKIAKRLLNSGEIKLLSMALQEVEEVCKTKDPRLLPLCKYLTENEEIYCILNRQPSLHRLSMLAFRVRVDMEDVIKIHPLVCGGYNADFDGDQMAIYVPITEEAIKEAKERLLSTKNLMNPSNGAIITVPAQDIILGSYILTNNLIPDEKLRKIVIFKGKEMTYGQQIFYECFPPEFEIKDYPFPVTKKELLRILKDFNKFTNSDCEKMQIVLDNIKFLGNQYTTIYAPTLSLKSFHIPALQELRDELFKEKDIPTLLKNINDQKILDELKKFEYSFLISSGARGSWDQARQMLLCRGFISNFQGEIIETPVKHSLLEGLNKEELFISSYGSRKGLLDVAINTGMSGYLSRKMIFACVNVILGKEEDCGTTDYFQVHVNSEVKAKMLIHRYHYHEGELKLITEENCLELLGKTISLRSPILCRTKQICRKCYGKLGDLLNSRFIGIIAAQALGETNTQLVLRTFHTSGLANIRGGSHKEMKQVDIISDLSMASKILHSHNGTFEELVEQLFNIYNNIYFVHFEILVSQLLWTKNEKKWRLQENRNEIPYIIKSIQSVPSLESWILGLGFSKPKYHLIRGILKDNEEYGIFDKIIRGERKF